MTQPNLTETQVLAMGLQAVIQKQAKLQDVILKVAESTDAVIAYAKKLGENPEDTATPQDVEEKTDKSILTLLAEDMKHSTMTQESPVDPDVKPNEVVDPADSKIAASNLDAIIQGIIDKKD